MKHRSAFLIFSSSQERNSALVRELGNFFDFSNVRIMSLETLNFCQAGPEDTVLRSIIPFVPFPTACSIRAVIKTERSYNYE